jgi:hypothetical protein
MPDRSRLLAARPHHHRKPAQHRQPGQIPQPALPAEHHLRAARKHRNRVHAYFCIMAWRSRSAAPDEVLPLELVILGDLR